MSDAVVTNRQRPLSGMQSIRKAAKFAALALLGTAMILWSTVLPVLGILYALNWLR